MKWLHTFDSGDKHEVKCSNCNYKVTYHGDKIPKRCFSCKEPADLPPQRAGSKFRTIDPL